MSDRAEQGAAAEEILNIVLAANPVHLEQIGELDLLNRIEPTVVSVWKLHALGGFHIAHNAQLQRGFEL